MKDGAVAEMEQAADFLAETRALAGLLAPLSDDAFDEATQFKGWTLNDVTRHLHFWNRAAGLQLTDEAELVREQDRLQLQRRTPLLVFSDRAEDVEQHELANAQRRADRWAFAKIREQQARALIICDGALIVAMVL